MKKGDLIYVVTAYRWGDRKDHSYPIGITCRLEKAKEMANSHTNYRGGKYECIVYEIKFDILDNEYGITEVYQSTNKNATI